MSESFIWGLSSPVLMSAIVRAAAGFASLRLSAVAEEPGPPHPAAIQRLKITQQDLRCG